MTPGMAPALIQAKAAGRLIVVAIPIHFPLEEGGAPRECFMWATVT
jgi:hypothetical protein